MASIDSKQRLANAAKDYFRIGARVRIKSATDILATLNDEGSCEGLSFMPQMVGLCGQEATLVRWVTSSCVPTRDGVVFGGIKDAVLLDVKRCDGEAFGGCQLGCSTIWKTHWLTTDIVSSVESSFDNEANVEALHELSLRNSRIDGRANCQATQLVKISTSNDGARLQHYRQEMNLNRVSVSTIASSLCGGLLARVSGRSANVVGTLARTPVTDLNLQPGDRVRVKSKAEIVQTLDTKGCNRGLWFDPLMLRYCDQELTVTNRIRVLVDETDGRIRTLKTPSVVLDDLRCDSTQRRFCSRLLHLFWRECWLQRV